MNSLPRTYALDRYERVSRIRVRRKRRQQIFRGLLRLGLIAGAIIAIVAALAPGSIHINDTRVSLRRGYTLADCARRAKMKVDTGDLVDVAGVVLKVGAGTPARALLDGKPVALDTPVEPGERFELTPAADVTEDTQLVAELLGAPAQTVDGTELPDVDSRQFVKSIRRAERGVLSKKAARFEVAYASAVVEPATGSPREKCIAFTFDDGPNRTWTPKILDLLGSYNARGTFFVLGQAVKPVSDVFKRELAEGHEVGTHSWHHDSFTRLSNDEIKADLTRCMKAMKAEGAQSVTWFRPPYGAHSPRVDAVAKGLGLRIALWDIDTLDWRRPGADRVTSRVLAGLKDGAVVLMHDGPAHREQTLTALRRLIPMLQSRGYRLVTMSEARGVKPLFTGEVVLHIDGHQYHLVPMAGGVKVRVNGVLQDMPQPPLHVREAPAGGGVAPEWQILVPARTIGAEMGGTVVYDAKVQTITVAGPGGKARFWLHSTRCEVDGKETQLSVPSALYGHTAFVPISVLKRVCLSSCVYDAGRRLLLIKTGTPSA